MPNESRLPIFASIGANVAIAAIKFTAAVVTGSSAMVAEGVHSFVDSLNGVLLLVGQARSRRPPDEHHPFGHGQELYFWSLMVAVLFFALGGCVSVYEGIVHLRHPTPLGDPMWNYIVLGAAALFDGASFVIAFRAFRRQADGRGIIAQVRRSKDPSIFAVVLEDSADMAGIALAFLGVWLSHHFDKPYLDGVASIGVGLVLGVVAFVLLIQTKSLLIGEAADSSVVDAIHQVVRNDPRVSSSQRPLTVHLGPHEVTVGLIADFAPELSHQEVVLAIGHLDDAIRDVAPDVTRVFYALGPAVEPPQRGDRPS